MPSNRAHTSRTARPPDPELDRLIAFASTTYQAVSRIADLPDSVQPKKLNQPGATRNDDASRQEALDAAFAWSDSMLEDPPVEPVTRFADQEGFERMEKAPVEGMEGFDPAPLRDEEERAFNRIIDDEEDGLGVEKFGQDELVGKDAPEVCLESAHQDRIK